MVRISATSLPRRPSSLRGIHGRDRCSGTGAGPGAGDTAGARRRSRHRANPQRRVPARRHSSRCGRVIVRSCRRSCVRSGTVLDPSTGEGNMAAPVSGCGAGRSAPPSGGRAHHPDPAAIESAAKTNSRARGVDWPGTAPESWLPGAPAVELTPTRATRQRFQESFARSNDGDTATTGAAAGRVTRNTLPRSGALSTEIVPCRP